MATLVRIADNKGRISLPGFANATVILEAISPNEFRVRKAEVIPKDELRFEEEAHVVLSERDARRVLEMLENPPPPNAALRKAVKRFKKHYG
jgi:uncharacterized protein (DUF1778 family)